MIPAARQLGASMYYGGLRALGVCALTRRVADAGVILCYHNVVPAVAAGDGGPGLHLECDRFAWQMHRLATRYSVVSLREFVDRMDAGMSLRSLAAVTFDDGYAGVFEHAVPVLQRLGIPATIFVVAGAVGRPSGFWWDQPDIAPAMTLESRQRWLTGLRGDGDAILSSAHSRAKTLAPAFRPADWNLIRARIGNGIDIGAHSATHRSLPQLNDAELDYELVATRTMIHEATGATPEFFAYPYGHWDFRVRDRVRAAGYRAAVTLDTGRNPSIADRWRLSRINIPAGLRDGAFDAWTLGFGGWCSD